MYQIFTTLEIFKFYFFNNESSRAISKNSLKPRLSKFSDCPPPTPGILMSSLPLDKSCRHACQHSKIEKE
jgi:hypothetical protein